MYPQLVEKFWSDVERALIKRYQVGRPTAHEYVVNYRRRLAKLQVGDTVFNRGEDQAVEAVHSAIRAGGFPPLTHA